MKARARQGSRKERRCLVGGRPLVPPLAAVGIGVGLGPEAAGGGGVGGILVPPQKRVTLTRNQRAEQRHVRASNSPLLCCAELVPPPHCGDCTDGERERVGKGSWE